MADEPENGVSNGLTQKQLLKALGISSGGWGDLRTWGAVYSHRQACVRYLRDAVLKQLDDSATPADRSSRTGEAG